MTNEDPLKYAATEERFHHDMSTEEEFYQERFNRDISSEEVLNQDMITEEGFILDSFEDLAVNKEKIEEYEESFVKEETTEDGYDHFNALTLDIDKEISDSEYAHKNAVLLVKKEDSHIAFDDYSDQSKIDTSLGLSYSERYLDSDQKLFDSKSDINNIAQSHTDLASPKKEKIYYCNQCEFKGSRSHLWHHKKSKHDGIRYQCNQCVYSASQRSKLNQHVASKHDGVTYSCDQCEYVVTKASSLKEHKSAIHEGNKFPCDQCDYLANRPTQLKVHKESKHEGIRYPCDLCNYAAPELSSLTKHKKSVHLKIKYPCDQCEFASTMPYSLKKHKKNRHGIDGNGQHNITSVDAVNSELIKDYQVIYQRYAYS